ncbi:MAG: aminoacyl-tRNA hydrolase [Oscillospiraceae bacterium]|nr:aminoacyl-tRNA hydrolase [Oscillospiraceae bacterium]
MLFRRRPEPVSWIVAFLGNPGPRFAGTRHNAGFAAAGAIEQIHGIAINKLKFNALTAVCEFGSVRALLMLPQTYMNLSGNAVRQAMQFYKVPLDNVIVISDDVALPAGKLRIRRSGSAGGHNGLKDIIDKCGGDGFARIKIGVGSPPHSEYDMAKWVLTKLSGDDEKLVTAAAVRAADALDVMITSGIDAAMAKYN